MTEDWEKFWAPTPARQDDKMAECWKEYAKKVTLRQSRCDKEWLPERDDFVEAVLNGSGAGGYDGWHSKELKLLVRKFPKIIDELYWVWVATSRYLVHACADQDLAFLIAHWRVVGIPKKDSKQSRPIGVGSAILRSWLSACEPSLPEPEEDQYSCKKGCTVVHAACEWLFSCETGHCGCERDLSKCYDMVAHKVAEVAIADAKTPTAVLAILKLAWTGPRTCQVEGEVATKTVWPTSSIA